MSTLNLLPGSYAVCRAMTGPVPFGGSPFAGMLRVDELTFNAAPQEGESFLPSGAAGFGAGVEPGWRVLELSGMPGADSTLGVMAMITQPLAAAGIAAHLLPSAAGAGYVLVRDAVIVEAVRALRDAGHDVQL
ncbi:MAG: ACT domain-containing protein [Streptosporangiales bacterium]|nr:ACT domain-containing protein [Streptosporangiales bacterium]